MRQICMLLVLMIPLWISAETIPTTGFDCEVSDTSPENAFNWWMIRGEARNFQVIYTQNTVTQNLSDASSTNVYLFLKASSSTNTYQIPGYISDASNGTIIVNWPSTSSVPVAIYAAEFAVTDSPNVNLAARGRITVLEGTSSGTSTTAPYTAISTNGLASISYVDHATNGLLKTSLVTAGTGISIAQVGGGVEITNTGGTTNAVAASLSAHQNLAATAHGGIQPPIAGTVLTNGANISALVNDSGYLLPVSTQGLLSAESDPVFGAWTNATSIKAGTAATLGGVQSVAFGVQAGATNYSVAIGPKAGASISSVAIGDYAAAHSSRSVAIGGDSDVRAIVPAGLTDTMELGRGTATNAGWLHYRGKAIVDGNGNIPASIITDLPSGGGATDASTNYFLNAANHTNIPKWYAATNADVSVYATTANTASNVLSKVSASTNSDVATYATTANNATSLVGVVTSSIMTNGGTYRALTITNLTAAGNANLAGFSISNGSFVGNGAGLTDLTVTTPVISTAEQVGFAASNNIIITTNNQYFNFTNTATVYAPDPSLVLSNENCTLLVTVEKGTNSLTLSSYGSYTNGTGSVNAMTITNSGPTVILLHRPIYMTNTTKNAWGWLKIL